MHRNGKGRAGSGSRTAFKITFDTTIITPTGGSLKGARDERAFVRDEGLSSSDPRVKDIAIELLYLNSGAQFARGRV